VPTNIKSDSHFGMGRARLMAAVAAMLLSAGCSDDGFGQRYPASGTVTYRGELVKQGTVNFTPTTGDGRAALGSINDGAYSLTTFSPGDGALPGTYKVSIISKEVDLSKAQAASKAAGAGIDEFAVAKAVRKSKPLIPTKYASPDTSGLTREIKAETNTLDFELTD
jgi:hypothetical protein